MPKGFTIQVKGLSQVLRNIERYDRKVAEVVDNELSKSAVNIQNRARQLSEGKVSASVSADTSKKYKKEVGSNLFYAPYVEFGTGQKVFRNTRHQFSAAEKAYARNFYVSGKGTTGSNPYLFPAFTEEIPRLMNNIKRAFFG